MTVPAIPSVGDDITAAWGAIIAGWGQAWTAYTPTLTASTTNPTLGTGGIVTGKYLRIGKTFFADIQALFGTASTNAGNGTYALSLPASANFGASGLYGFGHIKVAGLYTKVQAILSGSPATTVNLYYTSVAVNGALTAVTHAAPGAWTANDIIRLKVIGELA